MKTAVDWLVDNLHYLHSTKWNDILEQAKELEKQQMADAFYAPANVSEPKNFDEYYKQKYEDENTY